MTTREAAGPAGHDHLNTRAPGSHRIAQGTVGKPRRALGDPVSPPKEPLPFIPPPPLVRTNLTLPLEVVAPATAKEASDADKLVFHAVGDTGGVHGTASQEEIAAAMESQITDAAGADKPGFYFNLGDVIYFNGQSENYTAQFYEPYQYYRAPIFAIAGNHDGDSHARPGDQPDTEPSLYGFMMNFCDSAPRNVSPYRQSMTQPYVYWALDAPLLKIIGLYSNIGGSLDSRGTDSQQQWFENEMKATAPDKKILIAVHHPPYSLDSVHGGCPDVLNAIDRAIDASGRLPVAVLSGHVHNYQRFSRDLGGGKKIPYIVAGAGGYPIDQRSMHGLQKGLPKARPYRTTIPGVTLEADNETNPGFLRVTVTPKETKFEYFEVKFGSTTPANTDTLSVP
jgi:hypothetical protein